MACAPVWVVPRENRPWISMGGLFHDAATPARAQRPTSMMRLSAPGPQLFMAQGQVYIYQSLCMCVSVCVPLYLCVLLLLILFLSTSTCAKLRLRLRRRVRVHLCPWWDFNFILFGILFSCCRDSNSIWVPVGLGEVNQHTFNIGRIEQGARRCRTLLWGCFNYFSIESL